MKKLLGVTTCVVFAVTFLALVAEPQQKVRHGDSSAFGEALALAVQRLEGGAALVAGTVSPAHASEAGYYPPTSNDRYTCETYNIDKPTCDANNAACSWIYPHTVDPAGHTCISGAYTCEDFATCDTYDMQGYTCDVYQDPECGSPDCHTTEPAPYNHTCEAITCDGVYTCDITVDPRSETCNVADPDCQAPTYRHDTATCNPMDMVCRFNNPGHCTAQSYLTCYSGPPECDTPVQRTNWGKIKNRYR